MFNVIKTIKLIIYLTLIRIQAGLNFASKYKFFHFIFFLIYVGAILVLIVYLFFSRKKISFRTFSKGNFLFLILILNSLVYKRYSHQEFCSEFQFSIYKKKDLFFILIICLYIIMVLFSILKLDIFRFSSLRRLF